MKTVKRSRAFSAVKAVTIRLLRRGYRPKWTQITVSEADRQRLRDYCHRDGDISLVEGFHRILTAAGCPQIPETAACGRLSDLVDTLSQEANEYDGARLADRVSSGEFDSVIDAWVTAK